MIKAVLFFALVAAIGGTAFLIEAARFGYDRGIEEGIRRVGEILLEELEGENGEGADGEV